MSQLPLSTAASVARAQTRSSRRHCRELGRERFGDKMTYAAVVTRPSHIASVLPLAVCRTVRDWEDHSLRYGIVAFALLSQLDFLMRHGGIMQLACCCHCCATAVVMVTHCL